MLSYENTWKEIAEAKPEGAVIGIGAIEGHGTHLPLSVDFMTADYLSRGIAEALGWYMLPTLPIGASSEHMSFPGTLTLRTETLMAVCKDIFDSVRHHGIGKLAFVSGHGGNWFLKPMVREFNHLESGVTTFMVGADRWFYAAIREMTDDPGLHHGAEHETAAVMHLRPELVKPPIPEDWNPELEADMLDLVQYRKMAPSGMWGFASKATPETGQRFMERALELAIAYLRSRIAAVEQLNDTV